ncbi:transposase InsO family protein, partial [Novosphingobium sp. SG916]|nr:transposase InsO family protein [Novosphingobium sp. SG720]NMN07649.1 transposase InsO family protein [Novosphingobium sp. SG919]NMN89959.1 transposase InsO family protein [Novosphingobium sp. SG916]
AGTFEAACTQLKVPHRQTKAYTPQTNGMVERLSRELRN